ncbi:MAG: hypothetical protein RLY78_4215 [Pseudomonadota bacterium]|jgi:D-amino-acid dehydrogenase
MRVAVIGAGIVGVTTAFELAADGHAVDVLERRASVAEEASFGHGGLVAPGWQGVGLLPGAPLAAWRQWLGLGLGAAALLRRGRPGAVPARWRRRWIGAGQPAAQLGRLQTLLPLARYSQHRLLTLEQELRLEHEGRRGCLVLLRQPQELQAVQPLLHLLQAEGLDAVTLDADQARQAEPGLNPKTPLHAAIWLRGAQSGNGRQFAQGLRLQARQRGAAFRFHRQVLSLQTEGSGWRVRHAAVAPQGLVDPEDGLYDAVVVCAAQGAGELLAPLGWQPPLMGLHGWSLTVPLRILEGHPDLGPRGAAFDERDRITLTRLGQRVRVAGGAVLGARPAAEPPPPLLRRLYGVLHDWYPGATHTAQAQLWQGSRTQTPDGLPLVGATPAPGLWLNLGHGCSGWALAAGAARVLADQIGGQPSAVDLPTLEAARLR